MTLGRMSENGSAHRMVGPAEAPAWASSSSKPGRWRITSILSRSGKLDAATLGDLEDLLITADLGVDTAAQAYRADIERDGFNKPTWRPRPRCAAALAKPILQRSWSRSPARSMIDGGNRQRVPR